MIILTLRTDKPVSEVGLFDSAEQIAYEVWEAHRQLAETINLKIDELLNENDKSLSDLEGIVCYEGPGSFTGLRIGLSVANALSYSLNIPIIGIEGEEDWIQKGISRITEGMNDKNVIPKYGAPVHITQSKK